MLDDVTLVILAGGLNTRLRRVSSEVPKSMISFDRGCPPPSMLLADQFLRAGAQVVIVADRTTVAQMCAAYPAVGRQCSVVSDEYLGTAGALRLGAGVARTRFILAANADTVVPRDLVSWSEEQLRRAATIEVGHPEWPNATALLLPDGVQNTGRIGVDVDTGRVRHWGEGGRGWPAPALLPVSSTGVYFIDREWWVRHVAVDASSLENEILPELVYKRLLGAQLWGTALPAFDFGTEHRLHRLLTDVTLRRSLLSAAGLAAALPRAART